MAGSATAPRREQQRPTVLRGSVFAWLRGDDETLPGGGHDPHASQFVAEFFSLIWLGAGLFSFQAALVELLLPARNFASALLQSLLYGRAANGYLTPIAIVAMYILDTKCDHILQAGPPTAFRLGWRRRMRCLCRLSAVSADRVLDFMRHGYFGLFWWGVSKVAETSIYVCDLMGQGQQGICLNELNAARLLYASMMIVNFLTFCWGARTRLLQASLPYLSLLFVSIVVFIGVPLTAVSDSFSNSTNTFLSTFAYSVVVPSSILMHMLWEDSSRVDAATQFLQYMTHQVRGPSTSAGLALRHMEAELTHLRWALQAAKDAKLGAHTHIPATAPRAVSANYKRPARGSSGKGARRLGATRARSLPLPSNTTTPRAPRNVPRSPTSSRAAQLLGRPAARQRMQRSDSAGRTPSHARSPPTLAPQLPVPWDTGGLGKSLDKPIVLSTGTMQQVAGPIRLGGADDPMPASPPDRKTTPRQGRAALLLGPAAERQGQLTLAGAPSPRSRSVPSVSAPRQPKTSGCSLGVRKQPPPPTSRVAEVLDDIDSSDSGGDDIGPDMQLNAALLGLPLPASPVDDFIAMADTRLGRMASAARGADASLSAVTALLDRTLDLARLEAGHGGVQPSRFQVSALWSDVVRAVAPAYRECGVRLHFKVGDVAVTADRRVAFPGIWQSQAAASAWVLGDRLRLHQSLVALLDNGARYTPRGGHVRVSLDVVSLSGGRDLSALGITQQVRVPDRGSASVQVYADGDGGSVHTAISFDDSSAMPGQVAHPATPPDTVQHASPLALRVAVSDTGRGIDPTQKAQLFLPFARLHAEGSGTGLGLNIAKRAMRAHGGDVRVASGGAGQGSTFTLSALVYGAEREVQGVGGLGRALWSDTPEALPEPSASTLTVRRPRELGQFAARVTGDGGAAGDSKSEPRGSRW